MGKGMNPSYLSILKTGELALRAGLAYSSLKKCRLCPRDCRVDRIKNEKGFCRIGKIAGVASANIHHGEEPPISGNRGSGTIFFTGCNLRCHFCQNYPISQMGHGRLKHPSEIADMMIDLEARGAHNINFVTPSHVVPQILASLTIASRRGLHIPIVYNSSGYEGLEALELLDGVVDVYMPDIKYATRSAATKCSDAPDYWDRVRPVLREMFRQVGPLVLDEKGIAKKGMLIRHLVLPEGLSSSEKVFEFIATELSREVPVSLMSQYFPADRAVGDPSLGRRITKKEFAEAEDALHRFGLGRGWIQHID